MSTPGRAYDILRAYVNDAYGRLFEPNDAAAREQFDRELEATLPPLPKPKPPIQPLTNESARRLLGVSETASFGDIRREYEQLIARCDPAQFAIGSDEHRRAKIVRERVEAAYRFLRETADATELRFGTLEFD